MAKYVVYKLHEDGAKELVTEPCVVFRAQDVFAQAAIDAYEETVAQFHPDLDYTDAVCRLSRAFHGWRLDNPDRVKLPD